MGVGEGIISQLVTVHTLARVVYILWYSFFSFNEAFGAIRSGIYLVGSLCIFRLFVLAGQQADGEGFFLRHFQ